MGPNSSQHDQDIAETTANVVTAASSSDTTKRQGNTMDKILELVELTPETLARTFRHVGQSPERYRALLNQWFTPGFKPNFITTRDYAPAGVRHVELLSTAEPPRGQLPYRMFDIETGNLVEYPDIGARGQYCVLSHRWKGVELSLSYIKEARKKDVERSREPARAGRAAWGSGRKCDVQLALEQCRLDIAEQVDLIRDLWFGDGPTSPETLEQANFGNLLGRRLRARAAEDNLWWAKDHEDQTKSKLWFAQMEQRIFGRHLQEMQEEVEERMEECLGGTNQTQNMPGSRGPYRDMGSKLVDGFQAQLSAAIANLEAAEAERERLDDDIKFFREHHHLRDALDEMVARLQRWKSAIKLERAIQQAGHIFKTKLFQQRERSYLWIDTCCIDKANGGELSESLSLMGDWYSTAEYTLVQLDTRFREADAVNDWDRFRSERSGENNSADTEPNLQGFSSIKDSDPEWSTRAWTLQELVMSKTTFYVNSKWMPLGRPVESLGYFYHLIPFVALYTRGNTRNMYTSSCVTVQGFWNSGGLMKVLDNSEALAELVRLHENIEQQDSEASTEWPPPNDQVRMVEIAQQLIILLRTLGVQIPSNLTTETARSKIEREVYLASINLTSGNDKGCKKHSLYLRLQQHLPTPDLTALLFDDNQQEVAQHAIDFVLHCLVAETESLILADRQYIAEFGQVQQLESWQQGTSRTGFSAGSVLELSRIRKAAVATDRAYALMGILGVRFPTFSAEGYPKALSRLLDEVVMARNDISVFNWVGMDMGSPIRGRSMYPSSHTAYGNQQDRGQGHNFVLSSRVQGRMDDVSATYYGVMEILRSVFVVLHGTECKNLPFRWIERIVQVVLCSSFRDLWPQQEAFGKIIGYIKKHRSQRMAQAEDARMAGALSPDTTTDKGFSLRKRPALRSTSLSPASSFSLSGKNSWFGKKGESSEVTRKPPRFGLGKSVKPALFKKGTECSADNEPLVTEIPVASSDATPEGVQTTPTEASWQTIDREVMDYLCSPAAERMNKTLPQDVQDIEVKLQQCPRQSSTHGSRKHSFEPQTQDTISPNPIIVNSSGIEGIFDIQRVIVPIVDHERVRRQVERAASPHDKISGWCSVSTGVGWVLTSFACERRILEQQLDIIESVQVTVLREQDEHINKRRVEWEGLSASDVSAAKIGMRNLLTAQGADTAQRTDQAKADTDDDNTSEERLVSRMMAFIQEPDLELIAGEWVLARFSGVAGANWFLCHLELGPVPGQFYGHRIAAGAIDFHESTPELGLVSAWQTYMDRKKRRMCYILRDYLRSRVKESDGEAKFKVESGLGMAAKGLRSSTGLGEHDRDHDGKEAEESGGESDAEGNETLLDKVLGQGKKLAAKALGDNTAAEVAEKLFEMPADHLDRALAAAVLKRTPQSLRTAVENIKDNESLLPAMFHSSTRVHMF